MKLEKLKLMLQRILMQFNSIVTDKGTLVYNEDELAVGVAVSIVDEEGNESPVEDGEYYLGEEDGRTLVIENGVIKEIIKKEEAETTNEEFKAKQAKFNKVKTAFEESYAEKERQIIEAIRKTGNYDSYLIEAGDDYAVVDEWVEEIMDYKYFRYEISWNEEGEVIVGEKSEVKPAFVPVQEDVEKVSEEVKTEMSEESNIVEEIKDEIQEVVEDVVEDAKEEQPDEAAQRIADLEALVEELKARIKELEQKPAAEPAKEQFKKQNKNEDKLSKLINAKYAGQN